MGKVIAFGHRSRVGKDTCAKMLIQILRLSGNYKNGIIKVGFADALKEAAHLIWGYAGLREGNYYEEGDGKLLRDKLLIDNLDPVQLWINLGNAVREIHPSTWRDLVLAQANNYDIVVINDLRFPNEVDGIHEIGGLCIKVENPNVTVWRASDYLLKDYSNWDYTINNNSTLQQLYEKVEKLVMEFEL